jgi:hypothetical protein
MIDGSSTAFTKALDQKTLDEAARGLGRPLWDFEVQILDEILTAQKRVNETLARRGEIGRSHSTDEVVSIFIRQVKRAQKAQRKATIRRP